MPCCHVQLPLPCSQPTCIFSFHFLGCFLHFIRTMTLQSRLGTNGAMNAADEHPFPQTSFVILSLRRLKMPSYSEFPCPLPPVMGRKCPNVMTSLLGLEIITEVCSEMWASGDYASHIGVPYRRTLCLAALKQGCYDDKLEKLLERMVGSKYNLINNAPRCRRYMKISNASCKTYPL